MLTIVTSSVKFSQLTGVNRYTVMDVYHSMEPGVPSGEIKKCISPIKYLYWAVFNRKLNVIIKWLYCRNNSSAKLVSYKSHILIICSLCFSAIAQLGFSIITITVLCITITVLCITITVCFINIFYCRHHRVAITMQIHCLYIRRK